MSLFSAATSNHGQNSASRTAPGAVANSSPQILDLTRPGGNLVAPAQGNSSFSPSPVASNNVQSATNSSSKPEKSSSKLEQTEPMDFSSSPVMNFPSRGGFDASSFARNSGSSVSDLARFRTSSYSSFGLGAASYNSLLSNGYASTAAGYSPYGQSSYSYLNYPNSAGDSTSFSLSTALSGNGSAR